MDVDSHHNVPSDSESDPKIQLHSFNICTSHRAKGSKSHYRSIKSQVLFRLLHLGKRLLVENTSNSHNDAVEIAVIFLRSIPPRGYVTEDLFTFLVRIFHMHIDDEVAANLFVKFMFMAASTTPSLRPHVLGHFVRFMASKGDLDGIKREVQRRCNEWNLEKHEVSRHFKWVIKHHGSLFSVDPGNRTSDFRFELEHVLITYLECHKLPNASLLRIYVESQNSKIDRAIKLLNEFITTFPRIYFLRELRIYLLREQNSEDVTKIMAEDLFEFARLSGYSLRSLEVALDKREFLPIRKLVLLLFDAAFARPTLAQPWKMLSYQLLCDTASLNESINLVEDLFNNELRRTRYNFTINGSIARLLPTSIVPYYLTVGAFAHGRNFEEYQKFAASVEREADVTFEAIRFIDGPHQDWFSVEPMRDDREVTFWKRLSTSFKSTLRKDLLKRDSANVGPPETSMG